MVTTLIRTAALSALLLLCVAVPAQTINVGPSAFCHITDGTFTTCTPSGLEWSDITPLPGLGASQGALVYTDQRLASNTSSAAIMLMYELSDHLTPMGPAEFFSVQFDAQEGNQLNHYQVTCFGNGNVQVLENGAPNPPEGMVCSVGFGQSLTNSSNHVLVELEVPMNVLYSPDIPLFWSSAATPCRDTANGGCKPGSNGTPGSTASTLSGPNTVPESSTLVTASSSGRTAISVVPLNSTPADFCNSKTGVGILVSHIDAVLPPPPGGHYKNHGDYVKQVTDMTKKAIDGMINFGVLPKNQAQPLQGCVVSIAAQR